MAQEEGKGGPAKRGSRHDNRRRNHSLIEEEKKKLQGTISVRGDPPLQKKREGEDRQKKNDRNVVEYPSAPKKKRAATKSAPEGSSDETAQKKRL